MASKLVNLTGHHITIFDSLGNKVVLPPDGPKLGVDARKKQIGYVAAWPIQVPVIVINRQLKKADLPPLKPGTSYIVSMITAMAYPARADFIVPGDKVLDADGKVIGCKNFRLII